MRELEKASLLNPDIGCTPVNLRKFCGDYCAILRTRYPLVAFFGLPPNLPLDLEAARFALLLDFPPARPSRAAIHFFDPRNPSRSPGI